MKFLQKVANLQTNIVVSYQVAVMVALVAVQVIHQKNMRMAEATVVQTVPMAAVIM